MPRHLTGMIAAFLLCLLPQPGEAGEQTPACGGLGQRACCAFEVPDVVCRDGLGPAALGQFPLACSGFGAHTCLPLQPATACGGEGQRTCCSDEGAVCQPGLQHVADVDSLDTLFPVSGDATCSGKVISGSTVERSTGSCVALNPAPIAEPTTGWTPTPEPRGLLRGYHDMHLHLVGHMAHGGQNLSGYPAPIGDNGRFTLDAAHTINSALSVAVDIANHLNPLHGPIFDTSGHGTEDGARTAFGAPYLQRLAEVDQHHAPADLLPVARAGVARRPSLDDAVRLACRVIVQAVAGGGPRRVHVYPLRRLDGSRRPPITGGAGL